MLQNCSTSRILEDVELSAVCDSPVLISTNDSDRAREIGLRIHGRSLRRAGPFVVLNSRTLDPDVQFEAIGRAQGSLPDLGAVDSLRGGTLLLLHLEHMPVETQSRLCRFLERREAWDPARFRVIAATDRGFARVQAGEIREDLFYRLNVIHIVVGAGGDDRAEVERRGPNTGEQRGSPRDGRGPATERHGSATEGRGPTIERRGPSRSAGVAAVSPAA
jgi:two-component system response regulator AtoC